MALVKVPLDGAMETSLITLQGKALDARTQPTILGDTMSEQAFGKLDYDFGKLRMAASVAPSVAARAKHFDDWTREFLARHDRATVVHLGAGLDPRVWRVDPGPGVTWYDLDHPEVVEVRRQLFPERENYRMIGSSVTDPQWLGRIPGDLPTLVVAEGLTMYLEPAAGHELFRRITDHFARGVIAVDAQNRLALRMLNKQLARRFGRPLLRWAINDSHELERENPKLRCVDAVGALYAPSSALLPLGTRIFAKLTRPIPALRDIGMYLRYEFGEPERA
jgi:O-methyltransferase involved in polyketide biosynthesis